MSPLSAVQQSDVFSSSNDSTILSTTSTSTDSPPNLPWTSIPGEHPEMETESKEVSHDLQRDSNLEKKEDSQSTRPLSNVFSPFLTPPHTSTPRSSLSPSSVPFDHYNLTPTSTRISVPSQTSFSPPSSSALAHKASFDPVVGGGGGGGALNTPARSRIYSPRNSRLADAARGSISLPITPAKQIQAFTSSSSSLLPTSSSNLAAQSASLSRATWPSRSLDSHQLRGNSRQRSFPPVETETPTKKGKNRSEAEMLVGDEIVYSLFGEEEEEKGIATRYVLVKGLKETLSERDLKTILFYLFRDLSLEGGFSSRLAIDGTVVLVFHDIRDSLVAVQHFSSDQTISIGTSTSDLKLSAHCITRRAFEKLHDIYEPTPLLSKSEGVLVFTVQGSTSSTSAPLPLLSIYGQIRLSKIIDEKLHLVEFFDDRDAEKAFRGIDGTSRNGLSYSCSFEPTVTSTELPPQSTNTRLNSSNSPPLLGSQPSSAASLFATFDPFSHSPPPAVPPRADDSFRDQQTSFSFFSARPRPRFGSSHRAHSDSIWHPASGLGGQQAESFYSPCSNVESGASSAGPLGSTFATSSSNYGQLSPHGSLPFSPPISPRSRTDSFPQVPSFSHSFGSPTAPTVATQTFEEPGTHQDYSGSKTRLPPTFGIVRDDRIPLGNVINYERIEQGLEVRTTLMLKNIPNKLKDVEVMQFIEEVVGRSFDFFYLRTDYATGCNVGYGFVNFTTMSALLAFCKQRLGTRWNMCNSDKLCILSFANIQGKASLINHFKNSSVLDQDESRRPKIFVTSGPTAGQPERFPMCDDPVRKMRSALNAANVGLFPSQKPVFKIAQAFQGMNI
ncbi:hypothetical protein JCM3765_000085 [Sporobolomyces pararoseus]